MLTKETQSFLTELKDFLTDNYDETRAIKEKAYLYSDLKHYGVGTTPISKFFLRHKKHLNHLSKGEALELVNILWSKPSFEERNMALNILYLHKESLDIKDMPLIEKMMRECKGWALLDNFIIPIMPTLLLKDKKIYEYLRKWITDEDFWVRRSAILSQLLFFRKGVGGDVNLFLEFAKSQFDETWINDIYKDTKSRSRARFFIRKAIGWTLRDMSEKNPDMVRKFLKENKQYMSGLSFREGSRKLRNF